VTDAACACCGVPIVAARADLSEAGPICARCADPIEPEAVVRARIVSSQGNVTAVLGGIGLLAGVLMLSVSAHTDFTIGLRASIVLIVGGAFELVRGVARRSA
jgi:hypothetical protein